MHLSREISDQQHFLAKWQGVTHSLNVDWREEILEKADHELDFFAPGVAASLLTATKIIEDKQRRSEELVALCRRPAMRVQHIFPQRVFVDSESQCRAAWKVANP
mgnify:CR=1 FL=1